MTGKLSDLRQRFNELDQKSRLRLMMGLAALLVLAVLWSALNDAAAKLERKRQAREADVAEMLQLQQRFNGARSGYDRMNGRLASVRADDSPARLMEEIGIRGKSLQVKSVKGEEHKGAVEDAAEVKIEGLTANEAVNLLYRLERGAKPVIVRRALLKTRYDDQSRLDLTMTVALLKASGSSPAPASVPGMPVSPASAPAAASSSPAAALPGVAPASAGRAAGPQPAPVAVRAPAATAPAAAPSVPTQGAIPAAAAVQHRHHQNRGNPE